MTLSKLDSRPIFNSPRTIITLLAANLLAPLAWAMGLQLNYALTYKACSTGRPFLLYIVSFVTFAIAIAGALIATHLLARTRTGADIGGHAVDRTRFLAKLGLILSLGFAMVIIAQAIPQFLLSPCD